MPNELYAAVSGEGIWRSTDDGASFSLVTGGMAELNDVNGLFVDATTGEIFATSDGKVFRSADGTNWTGMDNECLSAGAAYPAVVEENGQRWLVVAILILLLSLLPMTGIWPAAWSGSWALQIAALVSLGPVLVVAVMVLRLLFGRREQGTSLPEIASLAED